MAEKEEEFNNTRKNHTRAMESMSASLEAEQRAKGEALRVKKALEGEINELEIGLDHANKVLLFNIYVSSNINLNNPRPTLRASRA